MTRTIVSISMVLSLSACTEYNNRGVLMAMIPVMDNYTCNTAIEENFNDNDPPLEGTIDPSPIVEEYTAEVSDAIAFFQVFENKAGEVVVDWDGAVLTGSVSKGIITVSWTNFEDSTYKTTHTEAGHSYAEAMKAEATTTVTLSKSKEKKGTWDGLIETTSTDDVRYEERDLWDTTAAYFSSGEINNAVFTWLTGYGSNQGDNSDCLQDPCVLQVVTTCNGSVAFEAVETDIPMDAFENVDGDGQPNGFGFSYYF